MHLFLFRKNIAHYIHRLASVMYSNKLRCMKKSNLLMTFRPAAPGL